MAWILLLIAGVLEVVWAYFMKQSEGFTRLVPTGIMTVAMVASFGLLALAMRSLPLGTAYAVWTGIGAIGAFVVGVVILDEHINVGRILGVTLIVAGLVVLKLSTSADAA
ncbi:DMT family transporter [Kordiimonas sp.]|uniref:DMT family transporter n=1 Tax=Kordiimonas sp. TaxID=1970157 RepID=UPI003A904024